MRWLFQLLVGRTHVTVRELAFLAFRASGDREARLHELLSWRIERAMTVAKGIAGTGAGFAVALIASAFKDELQVSAWLLVPALIAAGAAMAVGYLLMRRAARVQDDYPVALAILRLL